MNILLIAGHGNGDSGAVGNGFEEADLTREFVNLLSSELSKLCDVEIADTDKNWYEYLGENSYDFTKYGYVLEIHFNSGGGTGSEIYITKAEEGISVEEHILEKLCTAANYTNRGIKRTNFRVIYRIKQQGISSALLEVCFVDNASDMAIYQSKKKELARAVANGIAIGFGFGSDSDTADPSTDLNTNASTAVDWCRNNSILPNEDMDDSRSWVCELLYNFAKIYKKT